MDTDFNDLEFTENYADAGADTYKIDKIFDNFLRYGSCSFCSWNNLSNHHIYVYQVFVDEKGKIEVTVRTMQVDCSYKKYKMDREAGKPISGHILNETTKYFSEPSREALQIAHLIIYASLHRDCFILPGSSYTIKKPCDFQNIKDLYSIIYPILELPVDHIKTLATTPRYRLDMGIGTYYDEKRSENLRGDINDMEETELLRSIHTLFSRFYEIYYRIKEADHTKWTSSKEEHQKNIADVVEKLKEKYEKSSQL